MTRLIHVLVFAVLFAVSGAAAQERGIVERVLLPVPSALPTCFARADEAASTLSNIIIGQENGQITYLPYNPTNGSITAVNRSLAVEAPVDAITSLGAVPQLGDQGIPAMATSQGGRVAVYSFRTSSEVAWVELPSPAGQYRLHPLSGGRSFFACDSVSVWYLSLSYGSAGWELGASELLRDTAGIRTAPSGERMAVLSGREFLMVEASGERRAVELPPEAPDASICESLAAGKRWAAAGWNREGAGGVTLFNLSSDAAGVARTVAMPGTLHVVAAVGDSVIVAGGSVPLCEGITVGWLVALTPEGAELGASDHPVPVAAITGMDEYVVAHGEGSNLSVYTPDMQPLWDHASIVDLVALLPGDFDGDGSEDVAALGTYTHRQPRSRIDTLRTRLRRPDILEGARLTTNNKGTEIYVLEEGHGQLFLSRRGELHETVSTMTDVARRRLALGRSGDALDAAMRARAAAAALGHRDDVRQLTGLVAASISLPRRTGWTAAWAVLFIVAGIIVTRGIESRPGGRTGAMTAGLLGAGGAAWWTIGLTLASPALILGGAVPAFAMANRRRRRATAYARLSPGSPLEELITNVMEFIHGEGDEFRGSEQRPSDYARKNITNLVNLARAYVDSRGDAERSRALRDRLEDRASSFESDVAPRARLLARLGDETEFMRTELRAMDAAAADLLRSVRSVESAGEDEATEAARRAERSRERLVESADAVWSAIKENPGCSLTSVLNGIVESKREALASLGIELRESTDVDPGKDAVRMWHHELRGVIENLVTNASKAMSDADERNLLLEATSDGLSCTVSVRDTGRGMSPEEAELAFIERDEEERGGFGGLPRSRRLLARYGGSISVEESAPGLGTTMTITVPHWRPNVSESDAPGRASRGGRHA